MKSALTALIKNPRPLKTKMYLLKSKISIRLNDNFDFFRNLFKANINDTEVIEQSPVWMRATVSGLICSALFGIGWLSIAKTDEIVVVTGKLEPIGSVQDIQMPMGGIASEILVKDGEEVRAGQIVMKLDAELTEQRLSSLVENQQIKLTQLKLKQTELEKYLLQNEEQVKMLQKNVSLQNQIVERFD